MYETKEEKKKRRRRDRREEESVVSRSWCPGATADPVEYNNAHTGHRGALYPLELFPEFIYSLVTPRKLAG